MNKTGGWKTKSGVCGVCACVFYINMGVCVHVCAVCMCVCACMRVCVSAADLQAASRIRLFILPLLLLLLLLLLPPLLLTIDEQMSDVVEVD